MDRVYLPESITLSDMLPFFRSFTGEHHELGFLSARGAIEPYFNGYIRRQICATMISVFMEEPPGFIIIRDSSLRLREQKEGSRLRRPDSRFLFKQQKTVLLKKELLRV